MRRTFLPAILLGVTALAFPPAGRSQNIGTVNLGTVSATLASSLACTGSNQTFTTGVTAGFNNLGQTQHIISATSVTGVTNGTVVINGLDNAGAVYQISDTGLIATGINPILLTAFGYYTNIQVVVNCNSGGSFSLTYAGMFTGAYENFGVPLQTQINKPISKGLSAGSTFGGPTFATPYGTSSGVLAFSYAAAGPAGSSLGVVCFNITGAIPVITFPLATTSGTIQYFPVSQFPCTQINVQYISGGASATTYTLSMLFTPPGYSSGADPCQSPAVTKTSAVVTAPATSTTQIVAASGTTAIYACGFQGSTGTAAGTIQWITGSGVTCATGPTNLTGAETTAVNTPIVYGPGSTIFKTPAGNALCIVTTGATSTFAGVLTYVQQ